MSKRIGAICKDGTYTTATGRGAGSWHGGVDRWLYAQQTPSKSTSSSSFFSSGSSSGSSYSSWGSGYSGYSGYSRGYSSYSSSSSSSGSLWKGIKKIFGWILDLILIILVIIWVPFYLAYKLLQLVYNLFKPLILKIYRFVKPLIRWVYRKLCKLINFIFKNPQVIVNFFKPVFSLIYRIISFLSSKLANKLKYQHQNGWPILKNLKKSQQKKKEADQNENGIDYENIILDLKQEIESLQNLRSQIGKDITILQSTTLDIINQKEKQIQLQKKQINQLNQQNLNYKTHYQNQRTQVKKLRNQKLQYEQRIKQTEEKLKITLTKVDTKHKQEINQLKQNYQSGKLIQRKKSQQNVKSQKESLNTIISEKDKKIVEISGIVQKQKSQIKDLKNKMNKVIAQLQNQIKVLKEKYEIQGSANGLKSEIKFQQRKGVQHKNSDSQKSQIIESSLDLSSVSGKIESSLSTIDSKLDKTNSSIVQSFDSESDNQSQEKANQNYSNGKNSSRAKTYSKNGLQMAKLEKVIQAQKKQNIQRFSGQDRIEEKQQGYSACFKFFILFVSLWSIFFFHKLYEIVEILNR